MTVAATFACSLTEAGSGVNMTWAPPAAIGNTASPAQTLQVALISGKTEIAVPPGSIGFVIAPSPNSVVQKSLAFASTDAGGPIATALPTPCDWAGSTAPPANIWITAAAAETVQAFFF
jgi:hypothetical protein